MAFDDDRFRNVLYAPQGIEPIRPVNQQPKQEFVGAYVKVNRFFRFKPYRARTLPIEQMMTDIMLVDFVFDLVPVVKVNKVLATKHVIRVLG